MRERTAAFGFVLCLVGAVACSAPKRPSTPHATSLNATTSVSQTESEASNEVGKLEQEVELARGAKLPTLQCQSEPEDCRALSEIESALDEGTLKNAEIQLDRFEKNSGSGAQEDVRSAELILRGRLLLERGSLTYGEGGQGARKALSFFEEARDLSVHVDAASLQTCRALLALGRGGEALDDLERLALSFPKDPEIQSALGIAFLSQGELARSLEHLSRAVRLEPSEAERWMTLGAVQMLSDDTAQAERSFRAALDRQPSSARASGDLGALLVVLGRVEEGRAYLRRAIEISPRRPSYHSNLAYAELLLGRNEEAEQSARRALALDEGLASAWLNLGLVQVQQGRLREARGSFEKARELDEEDPRPINNLRDLDEIEREAAER